MLDTAELEHYFQALAAQDKYSGVVLINQGGAQLFAGAYGYASRPWRIPNSLETRFDTASLTKLFTAVAVLQLIDQGRLSLETRVTERLGLQDTRVSSAVNVFHLLTHTSGLGDDAEEEDGEDYADLWRNKPNYSVTTTADLLPQCVHNAPNFAPGQRCRYCNCGYVLLGRLVETISGLAYRDYVRQNIFARAGMARSDFFHLAEVQPEVAEGSDPVRDAGGQMTGWRENIYSFPPIGSPDGGAYVTAPDLVRFLRAVQAGELLSPALTEAFLTPQVPYQAGPGWQKQYGLGLWFYLDPAGQVVFYEKEGQNAGVSAVLRHFPQAAISVVLLSNMEAGVWEPIWKVHELIVAGIES
jgi:CubicO group peptidase (beta-lactamase class C family)